MNDAAKQPPAWDAHSLADPHRRSDKAARVEAMFDAIAPSYETVNRVATFGQDAAWRKRAIAATGVQRHEVALDLCCGTGDMVRAFDAHTTPPRLIIGLDFSAQMLASGTYPQMRTPFQLVRSDALRLPLADQSVDVITCAFGVRNFQDLDRGLGEMHRVLRPGGRVVILEFAMPENWFFRIGYQVYTAYVLPALGTVIARDRSGAYQYLPRSIETFDTRKTMCKRLARAGLEKTTCPTMNFGSVVIYRAEKLNHRETEAHRTTESIESS